MFEKQLAVERFLVNISAVCDTVSTFSTFIIPSPAYSDVNKSKQKYNYKYKYKYKYK